MRVSVGRTDGNSILHTLAQPNSECVVVGKCYRIFPIVVVAAERLSSCAPGCADDIETRAFRPVVANIHHNAKREGALDVYVPHLNVRKAVVLVHGIVSNRLWAGKTIGQCNAGTGRDFVCLYIGKWWLKG